MNSDMPCGRSQYSASVKGWGHVTYVQIHGNTANVQVPWIAIGPQLRQILSTWRSAYRARLRLGAARWRNESISQTIERFDVLPS